MNVVIVESPAKARSINKYLGPGYKVLASYGHVRDLPSKDGSVDPDHDFAMTWEADAKSTKRLNDIAKAVKGADKLILATDPDREGEAISWHVLEVLKKKKALADVAVERVVFNAITKKNVLEAMEHPRGLDEELIDAYLARRALDYLVGFTLSPVLWRKLPGSRSAGRVQSVALRIICDRELEIEKFVPQEYWSVEAALQNARAEPVTARLFALHGEKLDKFTLANEDDAKRAVAAIETGRIKVVSVESKPARRNPQPPFTTSTLQQEAARKLGFTARTTMTTAQRLYEGADIDGETAGLITYMRTDGVDITPEAIGDIRSVISGEHGGSYVPDAPRAYKTKAKNAQEAHEAIRPTDPSRLPKDVKSYLSEDQAKLYDLIWKRTVASQMESARLEQTTVDMTTADGAATLRATGQVILFDGFLKLYQEGRDDEEDEDGAKKLPKLAAGDALTLNEITPNQHFTQPPPRFTEASLVKKLEELGIGRPSTYASTLSVLRDRQYVHMDRNRFVPEDKGRLVTAFLESFFSRYVEYDFTAKLEDQLDDISAGKLEWKAFLRDFWKHFTGKVEEIQDLRITHVLDALNEILGPHVFPPKEDGSEPRKCPACDSGQLSLKVGRYGAFVGCSNYPDCSFTRQLTQSDEDAVNEQGPKVLGYDPETGDEITLRTGRFGPYVQQGEAPKGEKPKRSSIPRTYAIEDVDIDLALKLLSLPRLVGHHPEDGEEIRAGIGRYGPFVLHNGKYANLESPEEVFNVGINRAVTVLAEKKTRGRGQSRVIKELGNHPGLDAPIQVMEGRYGPYATCNKINATLPRGQKPEEVTLEQAVELIDARAAKGPAKKKAKKKKAAKKKTAKKKAAKKKTAKKKAAKKTAKAVKPPSEDAPEDQAAE